jgi:hypothetical protein
MTAATAFPPIDLAGITERPLAETLKKDPETPEFNRILRRHRRTVSQLRNARWPGASAARPEVSESDDSTETAPEPAAEPSAVQTPDPVPENAQDASGLE